MLNSPASGRRLALRIMLLQLAVALLTGVVFLFSGRREAVSATMGGLLVVLGTALMSARVFSGITSPGLALSRLLTGMFLKWIVIVGGLAVILFHYKLPPLAAVTGLVAAYAVHLLAFRFKG
ncbi:MAG TPA: ATP synthase subunit I [Rhodanobacter sp.]|nr:ATP synthase subunit I [Rhodanobacter sp.]